MFVAIVPIVIGLASLTSSPFIGLLLLVVGVIVLAAAIVVNSAASQLFRFVLYEYAVADRVVGAFSSSELDDAFRQRRRFLR